MHYRLPLSIAALALPVLGSGLAGCIGRSLTTSLQGPSASPTPDAFTCAREQLKALDFVQTSVDVRDYRVTARKYDEETRRPDTQFRRMVDRIEVKVDPGSGADLTAISVLAKTFAELTTQRGPTEEQERTSKAAAAAAETILQKCGGSVASPAGTD